MLKLLLGLNFPKGHSHPHGSFFDWSFRSWLIGDSAVKTDYAVNALYMNVGSDPFQVITDAVRYVSSRHDHHLHYVLDIQHDMMELMSANLQICVPGLWKHI